MSRHDQTRPGPGRRRLPPAYPPRYYEGRGRRWILPAAILLFFGLFVAGYTYVIGTGVRGTGPWIGGGLALFLFISTAVSIVAGGRAVRIIPYFSEPLPGTRTFLSGRALARNCLRLDRLAGERGCKSISAFGFNDALRDEPIVWHDPAEGLITITGLLKGVAAQPEAVDDAAAVTTELQSIREAFELCRERGVRFGFLLEIGWGTSGQVWELRQGSP